MCYLRESYLFHKTTIATLRPHSLNTIQTFKHHIYPFCVYTIANIPLSFSFLCEWNIWHCVCVQLFSFYEYLCSDCSFGLFYAHKSYSLLGCFYIYKKVWDNIHTHDGLFYLVIWVNLRHAIMGRCNIKENWGNDNNGSE